MKSYFPHKYIEAINQACEFHSLPVVMKSYSDHENAAFLKLPVAIRNILNPLIFAFSLRKRNAKVHIVLREFLTKPFMLSIPFVLPHRSRLLLVVNHNLQKAHFKKSEGMLFRFLYRLGFKFILIESDSGIRELGLQPNSRQVLVLPHCVPIEYTLKRKISKKNKTVGIVGNLRKEKGIYQLLTVLKEKVDTEEFDVLVGCPDKKLLGYAKKMGFDIVDTASYDKYEQAIRSCDVLIFNYSETEYYFRPSATIMDAVLLGTVVICPNYPVFKKQVSNPVQVGVTFQTIDEIRHSIGKALKIANGDGSRLDRYIRYRNAQSISQKISRYLERLKYTKNFNSEE